MRLEARLRELESRNPDTPLILLGWKGVDAEDFARAAEAFDGETGIRWVESRHRKKPAC